MATINKAVIDKSLVVEQYRRLRGRHPRSKASLPLSIKSTGLFGNVRRRRLRRRNLPQRTWLRDHHAARPSRETPRRQTAAACLAKVDALKVLRPYGLGQFRNLGRGTRHHLRGPLALEILLAGNFASADGGAISVSDNSQPVSLSGLKIAGNAASGGNGGGVHIQNSDASIAISKSTFSGNFASQDGGGLDIADAVYGATVSGSTFIGNHANSDGGGANFINGSDVTVSSSKFTANSAQRGGGLSSSLDTGGIVLSKILASMNSAGLGGGVSVDDTGSSLISSSTIISNIAFNQAGGLAIMSGGADTLVQKTKITGNVAGMNSGGVGYSGDIASSGNTITGNSAPTNPNIGPLVA